MGIVFAAGSAPADRKECREDWKRYREVDGGGRGHDGERVGGEDRWRCAAIHDLEQGGLPGDDDNGNGRGGGGGGV